MLGEHLLKVRDTGSKGSRHELRPLFAEKHWRLQVMSAQWYDGNISLPGCDKNMPGTLMAMARLNRPSMMIYGGTIKPGHSADGATLDIVSAFQSYGACEPRPCEKPTPSPKPTLHAKRKQHRFRVSRPQKSERGDTKDTESSGTTIQD